ncbi:AAA family ATPase [Candidatus Dojkabacteria bacterium]|nr:AAA family ATPase [Candidatus Dojkabacteria bacterium]
MQFELNKQQKAAVGHKNGPLLIIAGAGTGKTAVVTRRIINIINQGWAKPSEILALTFTEKAAGEMLERVDLEMPIGYEEIWISTFHSFCDRLLRQEGHHIGLDTEYTLMTQAQSYILFRQHLYDFNLDKLRPLGNPTSFISAILKHFSRLQDEDVTTDEYGDFVKSFEAKTQEEKETKLELEELADAYKKYTEIKIENSKLDFGDLIVLTLKLLRQKPNILKTYKDKFKYILVDEFQDTNYTQNVLVNLLTLGKDFSKSAASNGESGSKKSKSAKSAKLPKPPISLLKKANLTVVGDDDQAIYKFRGAAISNIMQFNETYPNAEKIVLTSNYRSRQEILDAAYRLIQHNNPDRLEVSEKIEKKLKAKAEFSKIAESPIQTIIGKTSSDEADKVAKEVLQLTNNFDQYLEKIKSGELKNTSSESEIRESVEAKYDTKGQSSLFDIDNEDDKGIDSGPYDFKDIAILVRAHSHSDEIVQAFRYYGIPYKFGGPKGLYTRPEVSVLISFLRLIADYGDDISMFNLLKMDTYGLEPRDIVEALKCAKGKRMPILSFLEKEWDLKLGSESYKGAAESLDIENLVKVGESSNYLNKTFSQNGIVGISNLLKDIDQAYRSVKEGKSIGQMLLEFFKGSGYLGELEEDSYENAFKMQNIGKYFETIKRYEEDNPGATVQEYIDYLDFSIEIGEDPTVEQGVLEDYDAVNILTVHGAKGLEFPVVFIPNLVNQRFPTRNMSDKLPIPEKLIKETLPEGNEHIQEERRLFYVGCTRAEERLYLSAAEFYGDAKRSKKPSLFLDEIMENPVDLENDAVDKLVGDNIVEVESDDGIIIKIDQDGNRLIDLSNRDVQWKFAARFIPGDELERFDGIAIGIGNQVSYTQLSTFDKCPKQYRYKYVLGLPGPKSATLSFGRTIHNTLHDFYQQLRESKRQLQGFTEKPDLDDLLEIYERRWIGEGYESRDHEETRRKYGEKVLKKFFKNSYDDSVDVQNLELRFNFRIEDVLISGAVDRVDLVQSDVSGDLDTNSKSTDSSKFNHDKKVIDIIDYKTGKVRAKEGDEDLQLALYTIALEEKFGYKVNRAALLYVEHDELVEVDISEQVRDKAKKMVVELVEGIRKGKFPADPGMWKCKFCDYRAICEEAV